LHCARSRNLKKDCQEEQDKATCEDFQYGNTVSW
jgi:hypothetical protein